MDFGYILLRFSLLILVSAEWRVDKLRLLSGASKYFRFIRIINKFLFMKGTLQHLFELETICLRKACAFYSIYLFAIPELIVLLRLLEFLFCLIDFLFYPIFFQQNFNFCCLVVCRTLVMFYCVHWLHCFWFIVLVYIMTVVVVK